MGKHPDLTESIQTFDKIIAPIDKNSGELAVEHLYHLGVRTEWYNTPEESETAKIFSTTYYGWNIIFEKMIHEYCEEHALDFENVYKTTNTIYNEGYRMFGDTQFVRPVLDHMPGEIGGHCVRQNCDLIENFVPTGTIKYYNDEVAAKENDDS